MTTTSQRPTQVAAHGLPAERTIVTSAGGRIAVALVRLSTGFIFLWAFLDKTFGLGFATPAERAWIAGGSPSQGFLTSDAVGGPLKGFFASLATPLTDVIFMLGLAGIGVAVMLGIGLRVSAIAGTVMLALMHLAEWAFVANAGFNNPLVDDHIVYAFALIAIAALWAGDTWGLGGWWKRLPIVQRLPWLA